MKRDAHPAYTDPAAPGAQVAHRNSRAILEAALLALQLREYTIAELTAHLQAHHASEHLDMVRLVERLIERGDVAMDGELLGLTDHGNAAAARIRDWPAPRISKPMATELERRIQALARALIDDTRLLTLGKRRTASSTADLAAPPLRPGAQACVELPSRIGNRLHYRDGRITAMDGSVVQPAHRPHDYRPTRDGRNPDQRMGMPKKRFAR